MSDRFWIGRSIMPDYGYAGNVLKIDISDGKIDKQSSKRHTNKYIGGHGLAASLYWEMVPPETNTTDPDNCFICATNGLLTRTKLVELDMKDIADDLAVRGLLM